ncbi:MAG: acyl transferase [Cytophagaceae bacterium]|nr:acyl transferase [Cytophagaceae bacterium]
MDFQNSFKAALFNITDSNFNEKAMELFKFQAENNTIYKTYLEALRINPLQIDEPSQIPFLPIDFFKTQKVTTGDFSEEIIFQSSGTTGQERSAHYVKDLNFYKKVARRIFKSSNGPLEEYIILALLPSYLENKSSSLIYMMNDFIAQTGSSESGFILGRMDEISSLVETCRRKNKKIILWGVTYALLDLAEKHPMNLSDIIIMETGGMKGKRQEMIREEVHSYLKAQFQVSGIHSEYGMTELLSQAYSANNGIFKPVPWFRILIRQPNDPFTMSALGKAGGVNIIDLSNVDSCAFIQTQDFGLVFENNSFEIRGRIDNSDVRGCNLLYSG